MAPSERLTLVRKIRAGHDTQVQQLEAEARPVVSTRSEPHDALALDDGVTLHKAAAEWCAAAEQQLSRALA